MVKNYLYIKQNYAIISRLLRHFPYTEILIFFIPLYALLFASGQIISVIDLFKTLPFVAIGTFVFIYNDLCDKHDPPGHNPVTSKASEDVAKLILYVSLIASILLFVFTYHSTRAYQLYAVYIFLILSYSGVGLRFKETWFGPVVAALVGWVGGPIILASEYGFYTHSVSALLFGAFLFGVSREVAHTIMHYDIDISSGYRTFAVRAGIKTALITKYITLVLAAVAFIKILPLSPAVMLAAELAFFLTVAIEVGLDLYNPVILKGYAFSPYIVVKFFTILLTCLIIGLSPLFTVIVLWIYSTSKRS